ncbi:hypothetical protein GTY67_13290 [Streptomyces sp. SID8374]|uniref:hypothetical protein n=1 Tax=Streptomyces sp. SID8374 TaxID=2690354 RepID=UPI00136915BF|nr:hypothetical protein [Streptomyces sp. SID8374]MYX14371.1 hypothetical protein [Streptomyces sp. SID8374]
MSDHATSPSLRKTPTLLAIGRDGSVHNVAVEGPFTEAARKRVEGIFKGRRFVRYTVLNDQGAPTDWIDVPLGFAGPYEGEPKCSLPAPTAEGPRADAERDGRRQLRNALRVLWEAGFAFGPELVDVAESETATLYRQWRETGVDPGLQQQEAPDA